MKAFTALFFLTAFSFLVEAKIEGLRPLNIVMPADPHNETEEWRTNMAAQVPNPKQFPPFKNDTKYEPDGRIVNGYSASRGQFPWQVAIFIDVSYFCGGSLISESWILTAAHCTYKARSFILVLGTINIAAPENGYVEQTSSNSIIHNGYNNGFTNNDIALIKLPQPVEFSLYISPVRLPSRSQANADFVGTTVQCSGWGHVSDTSLILSNSLQYVSMSVITNNLCGTTFGVLITGTKICVSAPYLRSPCNGDSGGPLVFKEDDGNYTVVGIVSFGHPSGCENGYPAVFTRVASYLDWIQDNTDIEINNVTSSTTTIQASTDIQSSTQSSTDIQSSTQGSTDIQSSTQSSTDIQSSTPTVTPSHSWNPHALSRPVMGLLYLLYLLCFQ